MIIFKNNIRWVLAIITILFFFNTLFSQSDLSNLKKRYTISGFPVMYYTPETRFAIGAAGICTFNFKTDSINAQRSNFNLGFALTQNKQVLFYLPYCLFLKNKQFQVYGELGYNKYFYNFYGVGNSQPENFVESYGLEFPRIRITALKKFAKNFYAGLRYAYDNYTLFNLDTTGQLITHKVSGSQGGVVSGFGIVGLYDSRDFIFYPTKGFFGELVIYKDDKLTGSTFNYTRIALDITNYYSFKKNTVAFNFYSVFSDSELPFFQMGNLGGMKKMRGFYEGRYRDNNLILFQAEYRRQVKGIFGFTIFGDVGQVAKNYNSFYVKNWRYTYGAGLRLTIDKQQKINLRFDMAVGNNKVLPYFTIGEAF